MDIPSALPPPIQTTTIDTPAKAGDVAAPSDAANAQLSLLLEMQSSADEATLRREEVARLTAQLLALLEDPTANAEAIAELQVRLDLALLRANQADQALYETHGALTTSLASVEPEAESHSVFYEQIAAAIGGIKGTYVDQAQDAAAKYTQWYQEYQAIASRINDAIKPSTEKGKESYLVVTFDQIRSDLTAFLAKYDEQVIGTFPTESAAIRFLEDAGLVTANFSIRYNAQGTWDIGYPNEIVRRVRDDMPAEPADKSKPITWSNPEYQAWLSRKTGIEERFQGDSRLLLDNFANVNSRFQNLNDILSETIKSMSDVDRLFLQSV